METKLSMSVMLNLLATCWFCIINMFGTGIKRFFCFVICMLYTRRILFLFYIFPPLKVRCWLRNKMVSRFIKLINLVTVLCLGLSQVFSSFLEIDFNWLFVIAKSYVKTNFKETIIIMIITTIMISFVEVFQEKVVL